MALNRNAAAVVSIMAALLSGCMSPRDAQAPDVSPAVAAGVHSSTKAVIGNWGFDLDGMDRSVNPGDDFFQFAGGTWLKNNPVPADRTRWGSFEVLRAKAEADVDAIIKEVPVRKGAAGSLEQKVADYYSSYLDSSAIETHGLKPFADDLKAIAAAATHDDVAILMSEADRSLRGPIAAGLSIDAKNPDRYVIAVRQSGLGMPNRDYYVNSDEKSKALQKDYAGYIETMLRLADYPQAEQSAQSVYDLEAKIAAIHWPNEKRRNRDLTYNLKTKAELKAFAGGYPWEKSLAVMGIPAHDVFVVAEAEAVQKLSALFAQIPVATWRAYLTFHYLDAQADIMPRAFDEARFAFSGRTLNGQEKERERWKRAVDATNGAVGEAVGRLYVAKHFSPQSKAKMLELVENVRAAYRRRIEALAWMSPATKKAAIRKLESFKSKIGYPDKWRDYAALEVRAGDPLGNRKRVRLWSWARDRARLPNPTDRGEWFMTPQTVNAYYNATFNEIVFPAAILQAPFFDPNADEAINYGAIGGVIGHEMGHGFDDQGAKSDDKGILRTWWGPDDVERFKKLTQRLSAQYSAYAPLPGLSVNGQRTLGENIGDLGGLSVAYEAYRASAGARQAVVRDGFTGDQRFFLGWAQVWRVNIREAALRTQISNDSHSPARYRVNGVVPNVDAWYAAFDVKPDRKLHIAPESRVYIW